MVNRADPRRILLLTFSRRAAAEMARRVERIVTAAFKSNSAVAMAALTWSGTFHGIGARLLREYPDNYEQVCWLLLRAISAIPSTLSGPSKSGTASF